VTFQNPNTIEEKEAKEICDYLGVIKLSNSKWFRLQRKLNRIRNEARDAAYADLGKGVIHFLENIEKIPELIKSSRSE